MKLFIKEACVVKGGHIKNAGDYHETGDVARKEDREAHDLIASGRALAATDTVAVEQAKAELAAAETQKVKQKAESTKAAKKD